MATFNVNGKEVKVDVEADMPLLWVLRDELGLTGTKYGCGIAVCGACTVHVDGEPVRSCVLPVRLPRARRSPPSKAVDGRLASGAESLGAAAGAAMRLLPERHDHGRCRAAEEKRTTRPTRTSTQAMTNICRCGTYARVREAIHVAAKSAHKEDRHENDNQYDRRRTFPGQDRRRLRRPAASAFDLPGIAVAGRRMQAQVPEVTHWIVIQPDDTVVIRIARSELGQGTFTGLAQLVAEELECDWSKVRPEYADVNEHVRRKRILGSMSTGGSRGIRDSQEYLRKAGAAAREMLVAAAAQEWGVPAAECSAAKGVITHRRASAATFGKVAAAAAETRVPKEPKLKDPKDWKLIGTSPPRFDIPDKTTGKQIYAADVRLPGHAARLDRASARCSAAS